MLGQVYQIKYGYVNGIEWPDAMKKTPGRWFNRMGFCSAGLSDHRSLSDGRQLSTL